MVLIWYFYSTIYLTSVSKFSFYLTWLNLDHNGRDFNSHLLKHALENNHQHVSGKDFKMIGNGFRGNNKKRKVAEALLIREIKPALNIQDQSVPLQLFS